MKPSFEKVHGFCRTILGLKKDEVLRLQCHRGEQCAFVKVNNLALAQKIVEEHDEKHEVEHAGKKYKLRITMEDGCVDVKVHDLPENVPEEKIVEFLSAFGEVFSLRELTWGEGFEFGGIPLGIWSARMIVHRNIDSWVTIDGQQAYIVYKGQIASCKYCKEQAHTGISCVQNKKLLFQKSYANVAKQAGPRQPPKKANGAKPPSAKSVGQRSVAPPPTSLEAFPELPKPASQTEPSGSIIKSASQPAASTARMVSPSPVHTQQARSSSSSSLHAHAQSAEVVLVDLFKKPAKAMRSQSRTGGNETDDSSTSTRGGRSRGRPPGKKQRCDDGDDEQDADFLP